MLLFYDWITPKDIILDVILDMIIDFFCYFAALKKDNRLSYCLLSFFIP